MIETSTRPLTFLNRECGIPFCKGCGHTHVIRKLNDALVSLGIHPSKVNLVTDIGCIGLADALFEKPHTVHTTHGRSTAFATGIELADSVLSDSKLKTIVLIGDGGAMIGLLHLVNAALLNVDVTVLLCNNFLFGMTGGQHSAFSPLDFVTPTTPEGNIVPPLDMCRLITDAKAGFVSRKLATDQDLEETISAAIQHPGFALVEIVELCTEHGTSRNQLSGSKLKDVLDRENQELGLFSEDIDRAEFGVIYADKYPREHEYLHTTMNDALVPSYTAALKERTGIIIAGSAGEKVQSAGRKLCEAAALSNLYCSQKNDNPVTQGSGFSISEVILSPGEIYYTGVDVPDVVIAVSVDGINELHEKHIFDSLTATSLLILDASLEPPHTTAQVVLYPFRKEYGGMKAALKAIEFYLRKTEIFPIEAFLNR